MTLNDSQCQVEEEERADEDEGNEEEEGPRGVGLLVHDHDFTPAFERDTLEHIKESPEDIVEVRDIIVRIERLFATVVAYWAFQRAANDLLASFIEQRNARHLIDTAHLEHTHEEVKATDRKDQEEEEQDDNRVLEDRDGLHYG